MAGAKKDKARALTKSQIVDALSDMMGAELSRKQVKQVVEALVTVGHRELKETGVFVMPGFAKFVVVNKPARPERESIDRSTKEHKVLAAEPARTAVRARPVRAMRDAVVAEAGGFAEPHGNPEILKPVRFCCPIAGCKYVFRRSQVGERVPPCPTHHCDLVRAP